MRDVMEVDNLVQQLGDALVALGMARPQRPVSSKALDRLCSEIAALRLPADVRRLWELVDAETLTVEPYPPLIGPDGALWFWQQHLETPGTTPRALLPIAYESHAFTFVELNGPDDDLGGALLNWDYGAVEYRFTFASIRGWLQDTIEALRTERFQRDSDRLRIRPHGARYASLADHVATEPHPRLGAITTIPDEARRWPEHWLTLSGIPLEMLTPAGADLTIAEALATLQHGALNARVHGSVTSLRGSADGSNVVVSDGTASIRVWCPSPVTTFGPTCPGRFEFLLVNPGPQHSAIVAPADDQLPAGFEWILEQYSDVFSGSDAIAAEIRPLGEQGS